jgi:peptide/nickel transport system permease protein
VKLLRLFARRVALGFVAAWGVLSAVFLLFRATDDWVLGSLVGALRYVGTEESEIDRRRQQYLADRGLDRPLHEQYLDWMGNMLTLQWGNSHATGEPAFDLVMGAAGRTAMYVLPAILLAIVCGTGIGVYAALTSKDWLADTSVGSAYLWFAVPNFWLGGLLLSYTLDETIEYSPLLFEYVLPIVLISSTLVGGYVSYARAHALEYVSAEFVKLVRAKGATRLRIATHVVRNAAIPLLSMVFTEALALLVLGVFVLEALLGIDGFGQLLLRAVERRDLPVLLGATLVIIAVGVAGNIVQDLSYGVLDPRVDTGRR